MTPRIKSARAIENLMNPLEFFSLSEHAIVQMMTKFEVVIAKAAMHKYMTMGHGGEKHRGMSEIFWI